MDPLAQISRKILVERGRQNTRQRSPIEAPPPYTSSESGNDSEEDDDNDDEDEPLKLTIDATHSIQGSNNLVPTSQTPLADASKFSSLLLHAVNRMNNIANPADTRPRRKLKVELTINCGISVVGDRNVVGNVGLKPKQPQHIIAGPQLGRSVVAGAKRKVEEVCTHFS